MKMRKNLLFVLFIAMLTLLAACSGSDDAQTEENEEEELHELLVDFDVPKEADVDETVELKATVTYGEEEVTGADVEFEYWEEGNEDDSTMVEAEDNEDGTYTAEVDFEDDAVYEMYAHTTAKEQHTMPKEAVAVGDAEIDEDDAKDEEDHEDHDE